MELLIVENYQPFQFYAHSKNVKGLPKTRKQYAKKIIQSSAFIKNTCIYAVKIALSNVTYIPPYNI